MNKTIRISSLLLLSLFTLTACATNDRWIGAPLGYSSDNKNAMNKPSQTNSSLAMKNESLVTTGITAGGRTQQFLGSIRARANIYVLQTQSKQTTKALGEFTGKVSQTSFGWDMGLYFSDYFYVFTSPIPYMNYLYTSGTKIRPLPGRTTDLGRTWDSGLTVGAGLEFKVSKKLSLGFEYRTFGVFSRALGVDSSGFSYTNHFYGLIAKLWF